jgi:spore germination protein GerM
VAERVTRGRVARNGAALIALAVVVAMGLVACSPGAQHNAEKLERRSLPRALREAAPAPSPAVGAVFLVYFLGADGLTPVARRSETSPSPAAVVKSLLEGPNSAEAAVGLHTALPADAAVRVDHVAGSVAFVQFDEALTELKTSDQVGALAQIVYTLTGRPAIRSVQFVVDGAPVDVPRADKTLTKAPVTRRDYDERLLVPTPGTAA